MEWISPIILLSTDFELIRSEIINFNYFCSKTQKCASYYLSKNFNCPDRAQWSTEAKLLLVYCATLHQEDDATVDIPSDFPFYTVADWITRLQKFNSSTKKKQVTRDCVFQLFRLRELQWPDLLNHPMLLAALAHRISVHELMSHRIEGKSIVTQVLLKPVKVIRYCFLESLYGAYKDDFQYIISRDLSELLIMVELKLKRCLTLLQRTKLRFPAIDFAFTYLHPKITESIAWYEIEPAKQSGFSDFYKAVYEESQAPKIHYVQSPANVIEAMLPYLNVLYALKGLERPKNLNEFVGDGQSVFPFLELPLEIIEMIILLLDLHSMQALRCTILGFKTLSANAKQLMKFQFPRKHHQLASKHDSASTSWETIYWRDSSILTRWNRGKYGQFIIGGQVRAMDENIMIASTAYPTTYSFTDNNTYFWMRRDDDTRTRHHIEESSLQKTLRFAPRSVAIIDSNATDPLFAVAFQDEVELFVGPKCISKHRLIGGSFKYVHSCNYKLYIDQYMYTLDERFPYQKVLQVPSEILDVNPMNDMFMSIHRYTFNDYNVKLHSAKFDVIGTLFDNTTRYYSAKFLDEYQVVGVASTNYNYTGIIDVADIRKMSEIVHRVQNTTPFGSNFCIDSVNRRVLTVASRTATIWDFNTHQWSGGFYFEARDGSTGQYSSYYGPLRANTRYLTFQQSDSVAVVFDFKN